MCEWLQSNRGKGSRSVKIGLFARPVYKEKKIQEKRDLMVGQTQNATAGTITYAFKYQNAKHYHSQLENNQNKITGGETNYFV